MAIYLVEVHRPAEESTDWLSFSQNGEYGVTDDPDEAARFMDHEEAQDAALDAPRHVPGWGQDWQLSTVEDPE